MPQPATEDTNYATEKYLSERCTIAGAYWQFADQQYTTATWSNPIRKLRTRRNRRIAEDKFAAACDAYAAFMATVYRV